MILGLSSSQDNTCSSLFTKLFQLKSFETPQVDILTFLARSCIVHSMNRELAFDKSSLQNEILSTFRNRKKILEMEPEELEKIGNQVAEWNCSDDCWEKFVNLMKLNEKENCEKKNVKIVDELSKEEETKQYEEFEQEIHSLKMRSLVYSFMEQHHYGTITKLFKKASNIYRTTPPKIAFRKFHEFSQQQILQKTEKDEKILLKQLEKECFSYLDLNLNDSEEEGGLLDSVDRETNRLMCDTCIGSIMCAKQIQKCFEKKSNMEFNDCMEMDEEYVKCIEKSYDKIDQYMEK